VDLAEARGSRAGRFQKERPAATREAILMGLLSNLKPIGGLGGFGGFPSRIASKRRPLGVMTAYGSTSPTRNSSPAMTNCFATGRASTQSFVALPSAARRSRSWRSRSSRGPYLPPIVVTDRVDRDDPTADDRYLDEAVHGRLQPCWLPLSTLNNASSVVGFARWGRISCGFTTRAAQPRDDFAESQCLSGLPAVASSSSSHRPRL
jgi:hypothetical protein